MDDESLFALHARFKAEQELPEGWYRAGEPLAEGAWVVDLDLFEEVALGAAAWEDVRGGVLQLAVGEDVFGVDVPEDAELDGCWTLTGAGLFEAAPGVDDEQLEEAEALGTLGELGRFGDLHVVPRVL